MKSTRLFGPLFLLTVVLLQACSSSSTSDPTPAPDPTAGLPSYLVVPTSLAGYKGSGQVTVTGGGLNLKAEGTEQFKSATNTFSGITGAINSQGNTTVYVNFGQAKAYSDNNLVEAQYQSNAVLTLLKTTAPGTYPMGKSQTPAANGGLADLVMNLPGPQLYVTNSGNLTVTESTVVKTEGALTLNRVKGTFQAQVYRDGFGISRDDQTPTLNGTFDLLLLK
ncbi:hypothetical protein GCM10027578_24940 [Spirosoma luteolum]